MPIKVGDPLYRDNSYDRRRDDPLFVEETITGETKLSWLVGKGWAEQKVNKKTMLTKKDWRGHNDRYYTQQESVDLTFCRTWSRPVGAAVAACGDPEKLKKIAEIIGMELK